MGRNTKNDKSKPPTMINIFSITNSLRPAGGGAEAGLKEEGKNRHLPNCRAGLLLARPPDPCKTFSWFLSQDFPQVPAGAKLAKDAEAGVV